MDHQYQLSHTHIGNISGLWCQGYNQGVKGPWNVFFVDFCKSIHKTNTGHDVCISSVENHVFDIG